MALLHQYGNDHGIGSLDSDRMCLIAKKFGLQEENIKRERERERERERARERERERERGGREGGREGGSEGCSAFSLPEIICKIALPTLVYFQGCTLPMPYAPTP